MLSAADFYSRFPGQKSEQYLDNPFSCKKTVGDL
ncbi:hypothetical protein V144x_26070 [Gimesia aquarii]|uniref:Uncharacterized protein n=1 Tax=Gimesia aquarii TaxID=2527964 RepID=A0A517VVW3_9PLAN|nr:hypothetical protein V144x_26070 [Gimesia aquarii]